MASQLRFHLHERFDRRRCFSGGRDAQHKFVFAEDQPRFGSLTELGLLAALAAAQFVVSFFIISHF